MLDRLLVYFILRMRNRDCVRQLTSEVPYCLASPAAVRLCKDTAMFLCDRRSQTLTRTAHSANRVDWSLLQVMLAG